MVEAANMGDPDAQYELGCRLRVEVRLQITVLLLIHKALTHKCNL